MKKIILPFIFVVMLSLTLFGCTPNNGLDGDGYINEDGEIVGGTNDGYITEDGDVADGGNKDDTPADNIGGGTENENPNAGDTDTDGENPDEGDNNTEDGDVTDGGDNDNGQDNLPAIGTEVGNRIADITLSTMEGGTITLSDLHGKIVILNAWASWCPPCKAELPDFDKIATEYKDHVVIIAADVDAGYGDAKEYADTNFPVTDIIFAYDTVNGDAYYAIGGVKYVPHTAIIDQNGIIIYTDSGILNHSQLVNIIENLLKN